MVLWVNSCITLWLHNSVFFLVYKSPFAGNNLKDMLFGQIKINIFTSSVSQVENPFPFLVYLDSETCVSLLINSFWAACVLINVCNQLGTYMSH